MSQPQYDDTDPAELPLDEIRAQYNDIYHELLSPSVDPSDENDLVDRKLELWTELEQRIDPDYPRCPECGATDWSQNAGDPKYCATCGLELGEQHAELIEAIDREWAKIFDTTDGGDEA